jgi:hypothetical protein
MEVLGGAARGWIVAAGYASRLGLDTVVNSRWRDDAGCIGVDCGRRGVDEVGR